MDYQTLCHLLPTWGGWLALLVPGLVFLWLHWREAGIGQLAVPFVTSIIFTAVLYRAGLGHPILDAWPLAALSGVVTIAVWLCWNNVDMRRHTIPVALALAISMILYRVGCRVGNIPGLPLSGPTLGFVFGLFGFGAFHTAINRSFNDFLGGLLVDMVFSEGSFGERVSAHRKLPELILLRHWREHGLIYKAYRTAYRNLSEQRETYPLWLFAAETAVREKHMRVAEGLIRRLCACATFSPDQKDFAVRELKRWAAEAGCLVDTAQFETVRPSVVEPGPLSVAHRLREEGKFGEADETLQGLLGRDPENLPAILLLARIYAQDMGNRRKAEKLLEPLDGANHVPRGFVEFARHSLDAWCLLPPGRNPAEALSGNPPEAANAGRSVEELLTEGRLGTALELAERQAAAAPDDFGARVQLLKIHAVHTGSINQADETLFKILTNPAFTELQKREAQKVVDECRLERSRQAFRLN